MEDDRAEAQRRLQQCLAGDENAVREFQEYFGSDIYNHPIRLYREDRDAAADFYVYAFDGGRIFRRLQSYSGRIPFRAYLVAVVLDHLVLEWYRSRRRSEALAFDVSLLDDLGLEPADSGAQLDDRLLDTAELLERLPAAKALLIKLLHIEDYELTATDYQALVAASGRSAADLRAEIEALRRTVRAREQRLHQLELALETVQRWIECHELRVRSLQRQCLEGSDSSVQMRERLGEAQSRLEQRFEQRRKLIDRLRQRKTTTPYRDLARLMNSTVGTVGAQIARLRRELRQQLAPKDAR